MNRKSFVISSVVAAVASWVLDFLLHGLILADSYTKYADLFGSMDQMKSYWWMLPFAYFTMSFVMGYIFIKGYEGKGMIEGIRFGFWIGMFVAVPNFIFDVNYFKFPMIFDLANLIGGMIKFIILGLIFAWLYKPSQEPSSS